MSRSWRIGVSSALIIGLLALPSAASGAASNTITIGAATPNTGNCFPFGGFLPDGGGWGPNFAFVYKNVPAFHLRPSDIVAFDLGTPNDTDNRMDVALAPTTVNGNDVNNGPFTTIATNAQTPANPRGDSTPGNYELQWTASAAFDFAGGGLLIRFSNPAGAFATDATCDADLVGAAGPGDASGFFVGRRYGDQDGVSPWTGVNDAVALGQFRVSLVTSNDFTLGKVKRNKHKGTAKLPAEVFGPGTLALGGKGVKAQTASGHAESSVAGPGTVSLKIKPKGKLKRALLANGSAKTSVKVTFTPLAAPGHPAGESRTRRLRVKLIQR